MNSYRIRGLLAVWLSLAALVSQAQSAPESEALLPDSTFAFVSIAALPDAVKEWDQTDLGQLLESPELKPFTDDLKEQLDRKWFQVHARLGVRWTDLKAIASGEVCLAALPKANGKTSAILMVKVAGRGAQTKDVLAKIAANLKAKGAKALPIQTIEKTPVTVFEGSVTTSGPGRTRRTETWRAYYGTRDDWLVTTDDVETLTAVFKRLAGDPLATLAKNQAYRAVIDRCASSAGASPPTATWFVAPFPFMRSLRLSGLKRANTDTDYFAVLDKQGFDAIQGVGGYLTLGEGPTNLVYRALVYAPPPYKAGMRVMSFPNDSDLIPQPWVPHDVAAYTSFRVDTQNFFANFGSLFDAFYGHAGVWDDTLKSMREDENAPFNLKEQLVDFLGRRVTILNDYILPIGLDSERLLVAIETNDEAKLKDSITKQLKNDKRFRCRQFNGFDLWEYVPPEIGPDEDDEEDEEDEEAAPAAEAQGAAAGDPTAAISVAHGHLIVATHADILERVLKGVPTNQQLANDADFRSVWDQSDRLAGAPTSLFRFVRTDEKHESTYELFRQGNLPDANSLFAKALNGLMGVDEKGAARKPELDGAKLPKYDDIRRQLGFSGGAMLSEENGWFMIGFSVGRNGPLGKNGGLAQPIGAGKAIH